ncbi:hypothetical protein JTE90_020939 [Oedothorax gibbosus]|uniref:Uncharacterized protein n=1 Tax=Oedothorax gibbosus TaxID=931172 RepID=A0AAV6VRH7_9ARAC|nr:hypothetical protein JTE90_020939 [Oedothorax gibbosus]
MTQTVPAVPLLHLYYQKGLASDSKQELYNPPLPKRPCGPDHGINPLQATSCSHGNPNTLQFRKRAFISNCWCGLFSILGQEEEWVGYLRASLWLGI